MWTKVNLTYSNAETDDALYWYNERPNIGALAAGAWKANMYAVEEYTAMKQDRITGKRSGRIDLYLASDETSACVEAKQCWVAPGTHTATLKAKMASAVRDAKKDHDASQKIAAVFYVMRVSANEITEVILKAEVERVRKIKPDALAWCFPKATRLLKSAKQEHQGFVWPGVIMALKTV